MAFYASELLFSKCLCFCIETLVPTLLSERGVLGNWLRRIIYYGWVGAWTMFRSTGLFLFALNICIETTEG